MEEYRNIYIACSAERDALRQNAERTFTTLKFKLWEERESSHYPPDSHYFVAYATNCSLVFCDNDDGSAALFAYRAYLQKTPSWGSPRPEYFVTEELEQIAVLLSENGITSFIPVDANGFIESPCAGTLYSPEHVSGIETTMEL